MQEKLCWLERGQMKQKQADGTVEEIQFYAP